MRRLLATLVFTVGAGGCLFPSLASLTGGDASANDASDDVTLDTSIDGSDAGGDGDASGGPILVAAYDFEDGGCSDWGPQFGTLAVTNVAHTGQHACMYCSTGGGSYFTADHGYTPLASLDLGASYTATIWIRVAPQTSSTSLSALMTLRTPDGQGGYSEESAYAPVPVDQAWSQLSTTFAFDAGGTGVSGYVNFIGYATGDCLVIDDFALYELADGG